MFLRRLLIILILQFFIASFFTDLPSVLAQNTDTLAGNSLFENPGQTFDLAAVQKNISKPAAKIKIDDVFRNKAKIHSFAAINGTYKLFTIVLLFSAYWLISSSITSFGLLAMLLVPIIVFLPLLMIRISPKNEEALKSRLSLACVILGLAISVLASFAGTAILLPTALILVSIGLITYIDYLKTQHFRVQGAEVAKDGFFHTDGDASMSGHYGTRSLYEYKKKEALFQKLNQPSNSVHVSSSTIMLSMIGAAILVGIHLIPIITLIAIFMVAPLLLLGSYKQKHVIQNISIGILILSVLFAVLIPFIAAIPITWGIAPLLTGMVSFFILIKYRGAKEYISDEVSSQYGLLLDEALDVDNKLVSTSKRRYQLLNTHIGKDFFNLLLIASIVWSVLISPWITVLIVGAAAASTMMVPKGRPNPYYLFLAILGAATVCASIGFMGITILPLIGGAIFALAVLFYINTNDRDSELSIATNSVQSDGLAQVAQRDGQRTMAKMQGQASYESRNLATWELLLMAFLIAGFVWALNASILFTIIPVLLVMALLLLLNHYAADHWMIPAMLVIFGLIAIGLGGFLAVPSIAFAGLIGLGAGGLILVYDRQTGGRIIDPKERNTNELENHMHYTVFLDGLRGSRMGSGRYNALALIVTALVMASVYWMIPLMSSIFVGGILISPILIIAFLLGFTLVLDQEIITYKNLKGFLSIFIVLGLVFTAWALVLKIEVIALMGIAFIGMGLLYYIYQQIRDPNYHWNHKIENLLQHKEENLVDRELVGQLSEDILQQRSPIDKLVALDEHAKEIYKILGGEISPYLTKQEDKKVNLYRFLPSLDNGRIAPSQTNSSYYQVGEEKIWFADDLILDAEFNMHWSQLNTEQASQKKMREFLLNYLKLKTYREPTSHGSLFAGAIVGQAGDYQLESYSESLIHEISHYARNRAKKVASSKNIEPFQLTQAQFNPHNGSPIYNALRIADIMRNEKEKHQSDFIIFGELSLTGYNVNDIFNDPHFLKEVLVAKELVVEAAKKLKLGMSLSLPVENLTKHSSKGSKNESIGLWTYIPDNHPKMKPYNHTQYKVLLPTYSEMNEYRWFQPGELTTDNIPITQLVKQGFIHPELNKWGSNICEDGWNSVAVASDERIYPNDPVEHVFVNGGQILFNHSASPYALGKFSRSTVGNFTDISRFYHRPSMFTNIVGEENGVFFDGQSIMINSKGEIVSMLPAFTEGTATINLNAIDEMPALSKRELEEKFAWQDANTPAKNWKEMEQFSKEHLYDFASKKGMAMNQERLDISPKTLDLFENPDQIKKFLDNIVHRYSNTRQTMVVEFDGSANSLLVATLLRNALKNQIPLIAVFRPKGIPFDIEQKQKKFLLDSGFKVMNNSEWANYELQTTTMAKSGFSRVSTYNLSNFMKGSFDEDNKGMALIASFTETDVHHFLNYFIKEKNLSIPYYDPRDYVQKKLRGLEDALVESMIKRSNMGFIRIIKDTYAQAMIDIADIDRHLRGKHVEEQYKKFKDILAEVGGKEKLYIKLIQKLYREVENTEGMRNRFNPVQYGNFSPTKYNRAFTEMLTVDPDLLIFQALEDYKKSLSKTLSHEIHSADKINIAA